MCTVEIIEFCNEEMWKNESNLLKKTLWHRCFPVNFAKHLWATVSEDRHVVRKGANIILWGKTSHVDSLGNVNSVLDEMRSKHFYCFNFSRFLCFDGMLGILIVDKLMFTVHSYLTNICTQEIKNM